MARSRRRSTWLALALAGAVLLVDQAVKWVVRHEAARLPYRVVGGLRLELNYNSGVSFSRFAGGGRWLIALVAAVAGAVTAGVFLAAPRYRPALGLILGGALANLVDRLRFNGSVVDYIGIYSWPTFNVADIAIVVGTALLAVELLRGSHS